MYFYRAVKTVRNTWKVTGTGPYANRTGRTLSESPGDISRTTEYCRGPKWPLRSRGRFVSWIFSTRNATAYMYYACIEKRTGTRGNGLINRRGVCPWNIHGPRGDAYLDGAWQDTRGSGGHWSAREEIVQSRSRTSVAQIFFGKIQTIKAIRRYGWKWKRPKHIYICIYKHVRNRFQMYEPRPRALTDNDPKQDTVTILRKTIV